MPSTNISDSLDDLFKFQGTIHRNYTSEGFSQSFLSRLCCLAPTIKFIKIKSKLLFCQVEFIEIE